MKLKIVGLILALGFSAAAFGAACKSDAADKNAKGKAVSEQKDFDQACADRKKVIAEFIYELDDMQKLYAEAKDKKAEIALLTKPLLLRHRLIRKRDEADIIKIECVKKAVKKSFEGIANQNDNDKQFFADLMEYLTELQNSFKQEIR
jgi:hypothetical protein